jgi:PAS domain S-box-containing protein
MDTEFLMDKTPGDVLLAALPHGLCIVDGEGRILDLNPALEQLLGWHAAERRGQLLSQCLQQSISDPAQVLFWTVALDQALALGETTHLNLPAVFRTEFDDGRVMAVTGVVVPWPEGAVGHARAMVILHDVTAQQDIEGVRSRFLAVLTHELGTPVINLAAAADLLARHLVVDDSEPWRLLQVIRSEANRLRRLLAQFPTTSPVWPESTPPRQRLVTLRPLLRQVAHAFQARGPACRIVVQAPADLPFVWSDAESIKEVLSKLVDNALRYAPAGSQVALVARAREDDVVVSVRDHGPGVALGDEERIFEPWCRGSQEEPAANHHGLGLAMARSVVDSLGGQLWHERSPEGGASFCFTLPRAAYAPAGEGEEKEA